MVRSSDHSALRFPLSRALGGAANVRVLRALSRHGGLLSAPRLTAETRLAHRSVYLALSALAELGIVDALGSGGARLYSLRHDHPLAGPLSALFDAEERRYEAIHDRIAAAAQAGGPDIVAAWVYGSAARGDDDPTSDVDIALVSTPKARSRRADEFRERIHDIERALGFRASIVAIDTADIPRLDREKDPWWMSVLQEARPIAGEHPADLLRRLQKPKRRAS
jgi:predicted nucleotidyltransferase